MRLSLLALVLASSVLMAQTAPESPTPETRAPAPTIEPGPQAVTVTVDLVGSPTTGTCPYQMNLSWSAANASVCSKTGVWSGTAPASGSESVEVNAAQATYTLTCSSATDSRTIKWTNPTQNVDGTAVVLGGNKVYQSNSAANIDTCNDEACSPAPIILQPARTSYVLTGLPAGPRYVAVKATSAKGVDSALSTVASTTISLPTGTDQVQASCTPPPAPKPPTAVTIAMTVWETFKPGGVLRVGRDVGNVELGVTCKGTAPVIVQGDPESGTQYWVVPKDQTKLYRRPKSSYVVGRCETTPPA